MECAAVVRPPLTDADVEAAGAQEGTRHVAKWQHRHGPKRLCVLPMSLVACAGRELGLTPMV